MLNASCGNIQKHELTMTWPSYPTGRKFSLEFKFRYFSNREFAKFKCPYYYIFQSISMIA